MDYTLSFTNRAKNYVDAVKEYPSAFEEEFKTAVDMLQLEANDILLNIPCGGIYLETLIPALVQYNKLEISDDFAKLENVNKCSLFDIPYKNESVTKIINLACLHHLSLEERKVFYNESFRILKSEGLLVIGDVLSNSKQDVWLNQIVNKYNSKGHNGTFFTERDSQLIESCGFKVVCTLKTYSWNFSSDEEMVAFFKKLMNLDLLEDLNILKELLYNTLSIKNFKVEWSLLYFLCEKP